MTLEPQRRSKDVRHISDSSRLTVASSVEKATWWRSAALSSVLASTEAENQHLRFSMGLEEDWQEWPFVMRSVLGGQHGRAQRKLLTQGICRTRQVSENVQEHARRAQENDGLLEWREARESVCARMGPGVRHASRGYSHFTPNRTKSKWFGELLLCDATHSHKGNAQLQARRWRQHDRSNIRSALIATLGHQ